jgi:hypothetical protein
MKENRVNIPKREVRPKLLGFKASSSEVKRIKSFCRNKQISQSDFFGTPLSKSFQIFKTYNYEEWKN